MLKDFHSCLRSFSEMTCVEKRSRACTHDEGAVSQRLPARLSITTRAMSNLLPTDLWQPLHLQTTGASSSSAS